MIGFVLKAGDEMTKKPPEPTLEQRVDWTFGRLLDWHLARGTRPPGMPQVQWEMKPFATAVGATDKALREWRLEGVRPGGSYFDKILDTLLGKKDVRTATGIEFADELAEKYNLLKAKGDIEPDKVSLFGWLMRSDVGKHIAKLSENYKQASHPLIRGSAEYLTATFFRELDVLPDRGPMMDHRQFAHFTGPYLKAATSIAAFSRSNVTDWLESSGERFLEAQKGKPVRRIFVVDSADTYRRYAQDVFPDHAKMYGPENMLIVSAHGANRRIAGLAAEARIRDDEDFAIYDDSVVAFCTGPDRMAFRTDKLEGCRLVFETVARYAAKRRQDYASLAQTGADAVFQE